MQRYRIIGYLVPAAAFTIQHFLFIYHWVTPLPFAMAVVGLFLFAIAVQKLYEASDSIVTPWVAHVLGDVAMMSIAFSLLW